jgi:hypothetical protein
MIQRERVKPATGVPLFFEIERLGVKAPSQFAPGGFEFRYEGALLEGDQRKPALSYLAPEAHAAIEAAGARIGDTVRILKTRDGQYVVKVISDAAPVPEPVRQIRVVAPAATNGNGHSNGYAKPAQVIPESHPLEERYTRIFVTAAHALQNAHQQLTNEGIALEMFTWEDIRALGIHYAITVERREERR